MSVTFEKVLVLKNIPLFAEVSELAMSDLIAVCEEKNYDAGDVIVQANHPSPYLHMILSGSVQMQAGGKTIQELQARQVFGDTTVMSDLPFPHAAVAREKTILLRVRGDQLYRMMSLHPTLAYGFVGSLSKRIRQEENKNNS